MRDHGGRIGGRTGKRKTGKTLGVRGEKGQQTVEESGEKKENRREGERKRGEKRSFHCFFDFSE